MRSQRGGTAPATWITDAIRASVESGDWGVSLSPGCELVVLGDTSPKHIYRNARAFLTAIFSSTQGEMDKVVGAADTNDTALTRSGLPLGTDLFAGFVTGINPAVGGTTVAGWRLRYSGSVNLNRYIPIILDIGRVSAAAGVQSLTTPNTKASLLLYTQTPAADVVIWSPRQGGGQVALGPGLSGYGVADGATLGTNTLVARAVSADVNLEIESITMRDIYPRFGACPPASPVGDLELDDITDLSDEIEGDDDYFDEDGRRRRRFRHAANGTTARGGSLQAYLAMRDEY